MTPKERAVAALNLKQPDYVPTFELEFQLTQEFFGREFLKQGELDKASPAEQERLIDENAEFWAEVAETLEYSIIPIQWISNPEHIVKIAKALRKVVGDEYMITTHGDATFMIPMGSNMLEFTYWLADKPDEVHEVAKKRVVDTLERCKRYVDAGVDVFILCSDYCFNSGPFLSPKMFREFIFPYLVENVAGLRYMGAYVIKHTDGNIMPILDMLVEANPHAIHSIDPMAGVDIAQVKRLAGDKVCLVGNVNCALMQTGTEEEIRASAEYCLEHAKPGGGYIFSTSNVPFKGMPPESYRLILDVWKEKRAY